MAWYDGTFSCGHEGRINVIGPTKDRQWKIDNKFSGMCKECYENHLEEQKQKANKEAAEKAKEMELPILTGTVNQVPWANTIRQKFIDLFELIDEKSLKLAKLKYEDFNKKINLENIKLIKDYMLVNKKEAKWYINNRDTFFNAISECSKNALKIDKEIIEEKQLIDVKLEATAFPENAISNVVAEIIVEDKKVFVSYEKNESFRLLVKGLGYKWDEIWIKNINELTGSAEDRAAELGNKLLNAGFPIMILEESIREKAIKGEYKQECDRWVSIRKDGNYEGWLTIGWYDKSDLYSKARKLPGSRWDNPYVVIKMEYYKEVEEFAEMYDFRFTQKATKSIEEYKVKLANVNRVVPIEVVAIEPKDGLEEILKSNTDILDDLRDD